MAERPKFPAPLVIDTSLARVDAPPHSELKQAEVEGSSAGDCCRRRPLEGASSALFLCQRSWELRTLSRSKDKSSVIGSNFAALESERTRVLSLARFR